jgi:hypothetical protein
VQYESTRENRENCKKLERLIQRWGGQLIRLTGEQFYYIERTPGVSAAPFIADYAVHYEKRQIFCVTPIWYYLIHEMGHVFASPSMKASEYDFLGWEFLLARQLKGVDAWLRSNADYGVSPDADLGGLSKSEVAELLADRVEDGKRQGIIRRGRPVSIRV